MRVALLSILISLIAGCETYTVEYRKRPEYYANWGGEVPDRVVREDGTVVLYNADAEDWTYVRDTAQRLGWDKKQFQIR